MQLREVVLAAEEGVPRRRSSRSSAGVRRSTLTARPSSPRSPRSMPRRHRGRAGAGAEDGVAALQERDDVLVAERLEHGPQLGHREPVLAADVHAAQEGGVGVRRGHAPILARRRPGGARAERSPAAGRGLARPARASPPSLARRAPGSASAEPHARLRRGQPPARRSPPARLGGELPGPQLQQRDQVLRPLGTDPRAAGPRPSGSAATTVPSTSAMHVAARWQRPALELGEPVERGVVVHRAQPQDHDRRRRRGASAVSGVPRRSAPLRERRSSSRRCSSIIMLQQLWMHVVSLLATDNLCYDVTGYVTPKAS